MSLQRNNSGWRFEPEWTEEELLERERVERERQEKRNSRKRKSGAAAYKALHDIVTAPAGLLKDLKQMTLYKHTGIYATHDAF